MSSAGLPIFDSTLQESNLWLKSVMTSMATEDRHIAYLALKATLHALRDRIGPENAVHFGAQLPMLLRGLYYEGWRMAGTPTKERHLEGFLDHVGKDLAHRADLAPEPVARAVFAAIWEKIDPGEVAKVINAMPKELRVLWPGVAVEE